MPDEDVTGGVVTADPTQVAQAAAEATGADTGAGQAPAGGEDTRTAEERRYDESYVKELRQEAAGYRTKAKQYDEAFTGYSDEQKAAMLDIARGLADPNLSHATAQRLKEIAEGCRAPDPTP